MVYKFEQLSQREVESMLGITLKETRVYREIKEEGRVEGREAEGWSLILRQLQRRFGELPQQVRERVETLCLEQLENLGEALLDFTSVADLQTWLEARWSNSPKPSLSRFKLPNWILYIVHKLKLYYGKLFSQIVNRRAS